MQIKRLAIVLIAALMTVLGLSSIVMAQGGGPLYYHQSFDTWPVFDRNWQSNPGEFGWSDTEDSAVVAHEGWDEYWTDVFTGTHMNYNEWAFSISFRYKFDGCYGSPGQLGVSVVGETYSNRKWHRQIDCESGVNDDNTWRTVEYSCERIGYCDGGDYDWSDDDHDNDGSGYGLGVGAKLRVSDSSYVDHAWVDDISIKVWRVDNPEPPDKPACIGTELVDDPVVETIGPGYSWDESSSKYEAANTRFVVWSPVTETQEFELNGGAHSVAMTPLEVYTNTVPDYYEFGIITATVENTGSYSFTLLSACVQPMSVTLPSQPACEGTQLLDSPIFLGSERWELNAENPYAETRVRYTLYADDNAWPNRPRDVRLELDGDYIDLTGILRGNNTYTETLPRTGTTDDSVLNLAVENNSGDSRGIVVLGACSYPSGPQPVNCINDDADLEEPAYWIQDGGAVITNGIASLSPSGYVWQNVDVEPGNAYSVAIKARADQSSQLRGALGLDSEVRNVAGGNVWEEYHISAPVQSTESTPQAVTAENVDAFDSLEIDSICVYTGTEEGADVPVCYNEDPAFYNPDKWLTFDGAVVDSGATMPAGSRVRSQAVIPLSVGSYTVTVSAKTSSEGDVEISWGDKSDSATIAGSGSYVTETVTINVYENDSHFLSAQAASGNGADLDVQWLCLRSGGDVEPPEPPPPLPPGSCYNEYPAFEAPWEWVQQNGASVTDNVATLPPGATIYDTDALPEGVYQIAATAKATTTPQTIQLWYGDYQDSVTVEPDRWITYTSSEIYVTTYDHTDFGITADSGNSGNVDVSYVCIQWLRGPEPPDEGSPFWHPVCKRDWLDVDNIGTALKTLEIGPTRDHGGMPVHAIGAGSVLTNGESVSYDGNNYDMCIVLQHDLVDEVSSERSYYCNLQETRVSEGSTVRGELIAYTASDRSGNLVLGLEMDGIKTDPESWLDDTGWPDCRAWLVDLPTIPGCDGDNGNGTFIPARFNETFPGTNIGQYIPWLGRKLYDTVAYPILCGLVNFINSIINAIGVLLNGLMRAFEPAAVMALRLGAVVGYILKQSYIAFNEMMATIGSLTSLLQCIRNIVNYFIQAIGAAATAEASLDSLDPSTVIGTGMSIALTLVNSTVANVVLIPMTGLLMAVSAWKMVPWSIRTLRRAAGMGEG